jgi:hypothetical protein
MQFVETKIQARSVPPWLHIPAQVIVAGFCAYWYWHPPVPNKAVLILTGVTVLMALLEMRASHKAIYLILVLLLMSIENRAINLDRAATMKEEGERRIEERKKFQGIADDLQKAMNQSAVQFDKTMRRSDTLVSSVADSIKAQTGGDSFAFMTFTAEPAQAFEMHWKNFLAPRGQPYFLVSVTSQGKYPLRGTHATMMDDERRLATMQEYNQHPNGDWIEAITSADTEYQIPYLHPQSPEAPNGEVDLIGLYPMPKADSKRLSINFVAPNGYWNEVLHLGRSKGAWHQCLSVSGPTIKQVRHPFIYCDSDWPEGKKQAERDWVFTPPKN